MVAKSGLTVDDGSSKSFHRGCIGKGSVEGIIVDFELLLELGLGVCFKIDNFIMSESVENLLLGLSEVGDSSIRSERLSTNLLNQVNLCGNVL